MYFNHKRVNEVILAKQLRNKFGNNLKQNNNEILYLERNWQELDS